MGPYVIRHSTNADYLSNLAAGPLDEYHLVTVLELSYYYLITVLEVSYQNLIKVLFCSATLLNYV